MSAARVVVGVLLVIILVITVRRSRVRRRDETPEDPRRRDKLDVERSPAWMRKNRTRGEFGSRRWRSGGAASLGIFAAAGVASGGDGGDGGGDG